MLHTSETQRTDSSSRILAFGLSSLSYGLLLWLRTRRRCLSSTGFSRAMSGSTIAHRWLSAVNVNVVVCGAGVVTTGVAADDVDGTFEASCDKSSNQQNSSLVKAHVFTGSLKITGKSKRGRSMYKNRFSDFSVSA